MESELLDNDNITDAGFASKKTKAKYKNDKYNVSSNKNVNPKKSGKNVAIVALIAIVAVVATVAITISIKKASMTKKFNQYYNNGQFTTTSRIIRMQELSSIQHLTMQLIMSRELNLM